MAVRLEATYYTEKGNPLLVRLWDSEFSGTPIGFECERIEMQWRGDEARERFSPIIGSECSLSILIKNSDLETFITDLVGAEEGRFTISAAMLSGLSAPFTWSGYITTDNVRIEDTTLEVGYRVEIRAVDGLGRLKNIDYNNDGEAYTGKETFVEHVLKCLNKLPFITSLFGASSTLLNVVCNWHEDSYTYSASINPLQRSRVSNGAFYYRDTKGNNVFSTAFEVLETICTAWGARLMYSGNAFWLIQVNEMNTAENLTVFRYTKTGGETVSSAQNLTIIHTPNTAGNEILRFSGGAFEFFVPLHSVQVDYRHIQTRNLLAGYVWTDTDGQTVTEPDIDDNNGVARLSYSGKLLVRARHREIVDSFAPYRLRFRYRIVVAGKSYERVGTINSSGGFFYAPDNWNSTTTGIYYDVFTNAIQTKNERFTLNLSFITLPLEVGSGGTLTFEFELDGAFYAADGSAVDDGDLDVSFGLTDNYLEYLGDGTFESQADIYRFRALNNATAFKRVELVTSIGDGPNLVSPGHIEVLDNGSEWVISDAWRVGNAGDAKPHSQILANEIVRGQLSPVKKFGGMPFQNLASPAKPLLPHLAISYASAKWLFLSGRYNMQTEIWQGDWFRLALGTTFTEEQVQFIPRDSRSGPPSSGSSGGTGSVGTSAPTTTSGTTAGNTVSMFFQTFLNQSGAALTITENGGSLPAVGAQIQVFQNGQKLIPAQYSISSAVITIDADTHFAGANYEVYFTIIQ